MSDQVELMAQRWPLVASHLAAAIAAGLQLTVVATCPLCGTPRLRIQVDEMFGRCACGFGVATEKLAQVTNGARRVQQRRDEQAALDHMVRGNRGVDLGAPRRRG